MSCWCGPKLRVPKWVSPTFAEARSSIQRRVRTLSNRDSGIRQQTPTISDNDYGTKFRNSIRRGRSTLSLRGLGKTTSEWSLRRATSFRDSLNFRRRDTASIRRRENTLRRKKLASEIRIIRRSHCANTPFELNLSTCSSDEGISEEIELDEMTKQADNLRREYEQLRFQEKWRDDMLLKLHQENHQLSPEEIELADRARSFSGVKRRADSLLDQIRVLIRKFLVLAEGEPGLIEACFQIIQEEELRDEEAIECLEENGFQSPDRPKKWKEKCLTELKKVPFLRVENTPQQDRYEDRNWLAKHMELMSQKLREDFNIVKRLFDACRSLDPDIAQFFVDAYYEYIAQHLQDIVSPGLRHTEIIQLLSWLTEHKSEMRKFNLTFVYGVSVDRAADSLLPDHTRKELEQSYMKTVHTNIKQWAQDALQKERKDWDGDEPPQQDKDGYMYTEFPVHLFDLLRQNLDVARVISAGTYRSLLGYCLDEVKNIVQQYAAAVKEYIPTRQISTSPPPSPQPAHKTTSSTKLVKKIRKTVEPRLSPQQPQINKPRFYVQYSVAALNNFQTIIDHSQLFRRQRPQREKAKKVESELDEKITDPTKVETRADLDPKLAEEDEDFMISLNLMRRLARECLEKFMTDLYAEMRPFLKQVGSKQWFAVRNGTSCVGEVCDLITNYTIQLRKQFFGEWLEKMEQFILVEYSKGFGRKGASVTCKNSKDRRDMAEQICCEADQMENTMMTLYQGDEVRISQFNILRQMAEVIQLTDKSSIVLEVSSLVMKHPEVTRKQLKAILRLRGDLKKPKVKKILMSSMAQDDTDSVGSCSGESVVTPE